LSFSGTVKSVWHYILCKHCVFVAAYAIPSCCCSCTRPPH